MNPMYNYPDMEMYALHLWDDKKSCLGPLTDQLEKINRAHREAKETGWHQAEGGMYDPKTYAWWFTEQFDAWKEKGLTLHVKEMGGQRWIAAIPNSRVGKFGNNCNVILNITDADYSSKFWATDTIEAQEAFLQKAADHDMMAFIVPTDGVDPDHMYINVLQEAAALYHVSYKNHLFLNISSLTAEGCRLSDVEGFTMTDPAGEKVQDPDAGVTLLDGLSLLPIDGIWANAESLAYSMTMNDRYSNAAFDREKFLHTETCKKMAEGIRLELQYRTVDDPGLQKHLASMGLNCDSHYTKGERWIVVSPKSAEDPDSEKLPVVCIFQEVGTADQHQAVMALSFFYEYLNLAAQGNCILLFFVMETPEDNELLMDILPVAENLYPIDEERVYITGHSHNGYYAADFFRAHPTVITAAATLGNVPGQPDPSYNGPVFAVDDQAIAGMLDQDVPVVNMMGCCEYITLFPLNQDIHNLRPGSWAPLDTAAKRADSWLRRLREFRCPEPSLEEIYAAADSADPVERMYGIPCDKTEICFVDGLESYIADFKNTDGNYHLRLVAFEDTPHMTIPAMHDLAWDFLRRFKRDKTTGKIVDIY